MNRGIETFFREAFDGLKGLEGVESRLVKGAGPSFADEQSVWTLPRTGRPAKVLGRLARRNAYVVEQWSSFGPVVRCIRRFRPDLIYYSDSNLGFLLYWFRRRIGVPYRLLFSNGGPVHPPFIRTDFVHQVAPPYYEESILAGEPRSKHFFVPYGITVPDEPPIHNPAERKELRAGLGLPPGRPIVLSVGWLARQHKRMDYVIEEIAALPAPRPFLLLLGAMTEESVEIMTLGNRLLGADGFLARSVPPEAMRDYYRAADCFVLASLKEGFGRVFLEALMHGLPVIAHRHPVMAYVLEREGTLADLSHRNALAPLIARALATEDSTALAARRWLTVRDRFGWDTLRASYREMFLRCAGEAPAP